MEPISDRDLIERMRGDPPVWKKHYTVNGFILVIQAIAEAKTLIQDADVHAQVAVLGQIKFARAQTHDRDYKDVAYCTFHKIRDTVTMPILVERGDVFMYAMGPILTVTNRPLPEVTAIDLTNETMTPERKSRGREFNDINLGIWMKTLALCTHRRGIHRISDIMRGELVDYIKHGRIDICRIYKKDPVVAQRGFRIVLPEGTKMPAETKRIRAFYMPIDPGQI